MNEKQSFNNEKMSYGHEDLQDYQNLESVKHTPEEDEKQNIQEIRKNIQEQAKPKEVYKHPINPNEKSEPTHRYLTKKIKADQYKLTLKHVQKRLPKGQRMLSSFVHKPPVETISEVAGKTIARPSGILGGGIIALLGSLVILFISHKVGFAVPGSLFAALFLAGFALGCSIEILTKLFTKKIKDKTY